MHHSAKELLDSLECCHRVVLVVDLLTSHFLPNATSKAVAIVGPYYQRQYHNGVIIVRGH